MLSSKQRGFSLLEILVAFTILAFSLTIVLGIFSTGVNSATVSEEYTAAVQIADSLLAKTGVETKLQNDRKEGIEDNKYRWEVTVKSLPLISGKFKLKSTTELYVVAVLVSWGEGDDNDRQVQLSTLKIANKEA